MKPARFQHWKNRKLWTLDELAFLLKGREPAFLLSLPDNEEKKEIEQLVNDLKAFAARDPNLHVWDNKYKEYIAPENPIHSTTLLFWVSKLEGIVIPSELTPLLDKYKSPKKIEKSSSEKKPDKVTPSLGEKEKENLLITIGVLAQIIFEKTGNASGEDKPNVSGIADYCIKILPHTPGMNKSTLRNRISNSLKLLNSKRKC